MPVPDGSRPAEGPFTPDPAGPPPGSPSAVDAPPNDVTLAAAPDAPTDAAQAAGRGLRQLVLRGGTYMAARQIMSIVVNTGGMLLLTQIIGPRNYGLYISAIGVFAYLSFVAQSGLDVYLIRREGPTDDRDYHLGFTLLLMLGITAAGLSILLLPLLERWADVQGFAALLAVMLAGLPITLTSLVPTARLERALDYRRLSFVEAANMIVYQIASLSAAFGGAGAWSPVIGWWAQQASSVTLLYSLTGYRPRLSWDTARARTMLSYGAGYTAAMGIWQMKSLVGPMLILPFAGPVAVAYVGLATRFAEVLSFVKTATWRLSIATLARLNGDRRRGLMAITEGMRLQVLLLGPLLAGFAVVAPSVMPILFGPRWAEWSRAMEIYPYIALGILCNAIFSLHSSMLFVLRENRAVAIFHAAYIVLLFGSASYFLPRYGLVGAGYAELVATASYLLIHLFIVRAVGSPDYSLAAAWAVAGGLLLFVHQLGWLAFAGLVAAALWPPTWRTLDGYARMVFAGRSVGPASRPA